MAVSYKKLWKLLIDKEIKKSKLCEMAEITTNEMAKMGKNEMVKMETLVKICKVLDCKIEDIMEIKKENSND